MWPENCLVWHQRGGDLLAMEASERETRDRAAGAKAAASPLHVARARTLPRFWS